MGTHEVLPFPQELGEGTFDICFGSVTAGKMSLFLHATVVKLMGSQTQEQARESRMGSSWGEKGSSQREMEKMIRGRLNKNIN